MLIGWSQYLSASSAQFPSGTPILATLGPEGTSSHAVARSLKRTSGRLGDIALHDSFEAAAEQVRGGLADLLLVAAAYSRLNAFLMDGDLELVDAFVHNTPAYVVAAADGPHQARAPQGPSRPPLYSHPSPLPLLRRLVPDAAERFDIREVASTSVAAAQARAEASFAFTNLEAAASNGLQPVTPPAAITMLWLLFRASRRVNP